MRFLENVQPRSRNRKPPLLSGHTVTVSLNYQRYHFNEMLYLVQMIVDAGGHYTVCSKDADTLYTFGDEEQDVRYKIFSDRMAAGEDLDVLPLKSLFDILETSEVKLSRKPKKDLSALEDHEEESEELPV